jgi:hypothetical protein
MDFVGVLAIARRYPNRRLKPIQRLQLPVSATDILKMSTGILATIDNWHARLQKEKAARALLIESGAPAVRDLRFRKQSHNAVVFEGQLDGMTVFLKQYETDHGPALIRRGVEETAVVRKQMDGVSADIAEIVWFSQKHAMVLMTGVNGIPVADALSKGQVLDVMPQVAQWLVQYVGPRSFGDTFSTSYWTKKRAGEDISTLSPDDQTLVAKTIALQRDRHAAHGSMPVLKARLPKDFAPHNLHWTGQAVLGFDIEGYTTQPISRSIAAFCVLAQRRIPTGGERLYGVHKRCLSAFIDAFDLSDDIAMVMPFLIADELLQSMFRRHDDPVSGTAIRRALIAHLSET